VDRNTEENMAGIYRDRKIIVNSSCIDFIKDERKWKGGGMEGNARYREKVDRSGKMERMIKSARMQ
jgi:hypothetical protein